MKANVVLKLTYDTVGAVKGNLYRADEILLSMASPASISAALINFGERKVVFENKEKVIVFSFPMEVKDLAALLSSVDVNSQARYIEEFATSTWLA
jgi:hypothetical protein